MSPKDSINETPENVDAKEPDVVFTLEILKLLKDWQQQHGLRHGDYQRYRGYCTRRIRRLRKVLKMPQGDRRHFKKKDVTESHLDAAGKSDERLLQIPLILAERAWAHAMQLRQEANTEPRKKFHLVQRMRKACTYALQLEALCRSGRCGARAKLEAQAYVAWMHGTLHFELQLWRKAAENYKKAQLLYETIARTLADDDVEQSPYRHRVDELAPSLRYCAYNIGDEKAPNLAELRNQGLIDNLDDLIVQAKEKQTEDNLEIKWENFKVIVRPEKVKLFLLSIKDLDASLDKSEDTQTRIALIEQMLIDCRDAINVARDEVRLNNPGAQLLLAYLLHIRLTRTVERNLYLIEQAKKHQDVVRLYEIILQQMVEMKQLSGMENNEEYQKNIDLHMIMYKAFRCFNMAKAYTITRRWREALVLYNKSSKYIKDVSGAKLTPELKKKVQDLQKEVESDEITAQAQCVIEDTTEEAPVLPTKFVKSKKPLADRLDEYREDTQLLTKNPNVVALPPQMEPIACKPLFFDLAFNLVKFPDLQDKLDPATNKNKTPSGMSGFVKGLFGWGGKK